MGIITFTFHSKAIYEILPCAVLQDFGKTISIDLLILEVLTLPKKAVAWHPLQIIFSGGWYIPSLHLVNITYEKNDAGG